MLKIVPIKFNAPAYNKLIRQFTEFINYSISSMTALKYHPSEILSDGSLTIKVDNDRIFNINSIETILELFKNLDFSKQQRNIQWLYREVSKIMDINKIYKIVNILDRIEYPITFSKFEFKNPVVKQIRYSDNSIITCITDPYVKEYGIFFDYSKPIEYFDYGYNCLHVFEHMMCASWKNECEKTDNLVFNGYTTSVGLCVIYTINETKELTNEYFETHLKTHFKARTAKYWEKNIEVLKTEIQRAYSETFGSKSLHDYFRTSPDMFSIDTNIFRYFASSPFKCLIYGPDEITIELDIEKLISKYPVYTKKPFKPSFNYMPLDVIISKIRKLSKITRLTKKEIDDMLDGKDVNYIAGINCKMEAYEDEIKLNNYLIYPLLIYSAKLDLQKYVTNTVLPNTIKKLNSFKIIRKNPDVHIISD